MKNIPLVSIFLPYYNDAKYLPIAIKSVLKQSYPNWELILCNHASTDNCREIAHSFKDKRIKHIDMPRNEGAGGGLVFEAMLKASSGEYSKTLCADDMLRPNALKKFILFMENNPKVDFCFADCEYIDEKGKDLNDSWFLNRQDFSLNHSEVDLIRLYYQGKSTIPYIGAFVKKELFSHIEINKTFVMMFDMSLWLQLLCKGYKIGYCQDKLLNYRIHKGQMSAKGKAELAGYVCWFETVSFMQYLMSIDDVELAKAVYPDSPFYNQLKDKKDIPFFVAHRMYNWQKPYWDIVMTKMLNDSGYREHLEKTFGFGVKELRELRKADFKPSFIPLAVSEVIHKINPFKKWKIEKIYSHPSKNLSFGMLMFLFFRQIFQLLTFYPLRKKKKKEQYSL